MVEQDINIWRFSLEGRKKYLSLIPHDLWFFDGKFIGKPMEMNWELPPPINISGKSKKLPDFVGWMIKAPLVSARAKDVLEPVIGRYVQFLPFHEIRGKVYYVMNVTTTLDDVLDMEQSDIFYTPTKDKVIVVNKAFFKSVPSNKLPPIFKLSINPSHIYVTAPFIQVVIDHQLTGAAMGDPRKDSRDFIFKGITQNIVVGVPTVENL